MIARPRIRVAAATLVATAVAAGAGGAAVYAAGSGGRADTAASSATVTQIAATASTQLSVSDIAAKDTPGVVEIEVTTAAADPFGGARTSTAVGSGFVLDEAGHIVTNAHVVDGAESVTVRFADGTTATGTVVGSDTSTDVAVVQVDVAASLLHPLALADSSSVEVGDEVVAIGSPYGLEGTVTTGIVSGLDRELTAPDGSTITGAIQTDAAVNHGNSGGPLLDAHGDVIGIISQIESESGGNDGVGFAVPSDTVRTVVAQLLGAAT
jgi:putative serine protease PepD